MTIFIYSIKPKQNKLILKISTADCIPIFLYDEILGVYGLLHAGWKGVVNKIHLNAALVFYD